VLSIPRSVRTTSASLATVVPSCCSRRAGTQSRVIIVQIWLDDRDVHLSVFGVHELGRVVGVVVDSGVGHAGLGSWRLRS
jgi:hypothetical protein